jgi:hypothetical protein
MIIVPIRRVWTRQPIGHARLDVSSRVSCGIIDVFSANDPGGSLQVYTKEAGAVFVSGNDFLGFKSGAFYTPFLQIGSGGAGNSWASCRVNHFIFRVTSNADTQGIVSIGTSSTDVGTNFLLQNNAGTLRLLYASSYRTLGTAVVGKVHCVSVVYSDFSPYPTTLYLDGVLTETINTYSDQASGRNIYLGAGYPTASTNADFILHVAKTGTIDSADEVRRFAANPWQIFKRSDELIFFPDTGGTAAELAGAASSTATGSASLTTQIPLTGAAASFETASGSLTSAISLSGAAASVAVASGVLTTSIRLSGDAIAQVIASGVLGAGIPLAGNLISVSLSNGVLTTQIPLSGAAVAQAAAAASLTTGTGYTLQDIADAVWAKVLP